MIRFSRRVGLGLAVALLGLTAATGTRAADKVLRVGYQKYGTLVFLKARGGLEERLKPLGYTVSWTEFPAGPQLLEALGAGAVDVGSTGEAPPIFAQAAGTPITYIGHEPPSPAGEAILVKPDSAIRSLADLKGKKVALNKGSNVHYLLVRALEKAGVAWSDITPVYLAPADGRAAFESGAVEAWAIWDPFFAAAEKATGARVLATGEGLVPNVQFYLASRPFADANGPALKEMLAALGDVDRWLTDNKAAVAGDLAAAVRIPPAAISTALARQDFGVSPMDEATVAAQQKVADTFAALRLLPRTVSITEAVTHPGL